MGASRIKKEKGVTWTCIPSTCLQGPAAESLQTSCSGIRQSQRVRLRNILALYLYKGSLTDFYRCFPFGTTLQPCDQTIQSALKPSPLGRRYPANSPYVAGSRSRAKTSQQQAQGLESKESVPDSGRKWRGSLAKYDQNSRSWKTAQPSLLGDWVEYSETWPRWGMTVGGELYLLPKLVQPTKETASGWWPTPTAHNAKEGAYPAEFTRNTPTLTSKAAGGPPTQPITLNPEWVEWLMGWPRGWSDTEYGDENETEYRKEAGSKEVSNSAGRCLRPLRINDAITSPSQGSRSHKQSSREYCSTLLDLPRSGTQKSQAVQLRCVRYWFPAQKVQESKALWNGILFERNGEEISRVTARTKKGCDRLKALGNGQVPHAAALAWRTLTEGL